MTITRVTVGPLTGLALAVLALGMGDAARGAEPRMLATCLPVSRAAAEAAKGPGATVMEALAQVWVFSIGAAGVWTLDGKSVAEIGPLPVKEGAQYTAQYMEAIFPPGGTSQ
jgi:hypothetical protein